MVKKLTKKEQEELMRQYQNKFSLGGILGKALAYSIILFGILVLAAGSKFLVGYLFL